jgi:hypothetical protein
MPKTPFFCRLYGQNLAIKVLDNLQSSTIVELLPKHRFSAVYTVKTLPFFCQLVCNFS